MDEHLKEQILPTENVFQIINSRMPHISKKLQVDGSVQSREGFCVHKEPGDLKLKAPVQFIVHETPNHYIDLGSLQLDIDIALTKSDFTRSAPFNDTKGYFINNLGQSLWDSVKVFLNDTCVQSTFHNPQICNLVQILNTTNEHVRLFGEPQGAFEVTDTSLPDTVTDAHLAKEDIVERIAFSKKESIKLRVPLNLDIASADKLLVDGITLKIILYPSQANYMVNCAAGTTLEYIIKDVSLSLTKIKPTNAALLACNKIMLTKEIEYLVRRHPIYEQIITLGSTEATVMRPFAGYVPNQLQIWFVNQDASSGNFTKTPFRLHHYNLDSYSVKINDMEVAGSHVSNGDFTGVYADSQRSFASDYFIPYKNYLNGSFVLVVDAGLQSTESSLNIDRRGNLSVNLRFKVPLPENVKLYLSGTIDSTFSINNDRVVTTSYQL